MEFLKRNALDFLNYAKLLLHDNKYNLALFSLEQALQLGLKYYISMLTGSFPKTHDVVDLLKKIIELTRNKKLKEILDSEISTLDLLKQAYIASMYLPTTYDKEAVEKTLNVVEAILNELGIS
ncbi:HEPN domain-containing protein [Sulfolobus sp. S-194]|uniref:HEPN domain-containing protein n=1 Tax=Sulfolobus sp. S-194 TaxID=2512240 RepID=UPI001436CFAE|nr:HEPN domain-containing protein [Sulfolobus sp. S-194]QIW23654.1 HEPN domain-containing protein [Sulfolobus sp. S-194]